MSINLQKRKKEYLDNTKDITKRIVVCGGTACVAQGSLKIYDKFVKLLAEQNIPVETLINHESHGNHISKSGCQGFCQMGPLVMIYPQDVMYCMVKVEDVEEIIERSILKDEIIDRLVYVNPANGDHCQHIDDIPFYQKQHRFTLQQCGHIDPEDINEYISLDGYAAAKEMYLNYTSEEICNFYTESGLRGRGGGGFPTGLKWEFARREKSDDKYVICNGDEGDPGAFMDRSLMEGNPHSIIEGMIIAARAIGANYGYIYVRAEYPLAVKRIKKAVKDAQNAGILGKNIFGSEYHFDLSVMEGAGAFVCGQETALMRSIEGRRGMPTPKPPYPSTKGLFGKPTVINNVETLSTVPLIFNLGLEEFKKIGTDNSSGTKTFALTGHVANTGLIEVPFGTTLREIIGDISGGVVNDQGEIVGTDFKAVQIGGPSGGCLTHEHLDLPLDFDSLSSAGAMVGSGGLVVMNHDTCMVQIAKFFMEFTQHESCGKCTPCREGTKRMLEILGTITEGKATMDDLDKLERLAKSVKSGSLCGLGKTAPNPVLSTLRYFKDEYIAHIKNKECPAGQCSALTKYFITDGCIGCTKCARECPVDAISGEVRERHKIDQETCIKCGACEEACPVDAIILN